MAYTPTEWKDGDVITAEKLNNIENGIENEFFIIKVDVEAGVDGNNYTANKTYAEAMQAYQEGKQIIFVLHEEYNCDTILFGEWVYGEGDPDYFKCVDLHMSNAFNNSFLINELTYYFKENGFLINHKHTYTINATKNN